jgi:hypothetical protein
MLWMSGVHHRSVTGVIGVDHSELYTFGDGEADDKFCQFFIDSARIQSSQKT